MELNTKSKMVTALFALLLTLILFTNANNPEQNKQQKPAYNYEETVKQVPIVFEYNEKKYYIQGYEPNVDVKLSSANRVQLLAESNADTRTFKVVADLNGLSPGTHEVKLKVENLKSGVKAKLSTNKSTVTIEKKITKKFAVKPILADEHQLDGVILSSISSTPKSVVVTTGAQTMKEIAIVQALFTSSNPITQNITKTVKLEALNAKGEKLDVTFDKEEVEVHLAVNRVNKQGVPIPAVLFSALLIFGCVLLNYFVPEDALSHLMYVVVGALVLNWAMITLTHLKFRQAIKQASIQTKFPALWSPFSNYLVLAFIAVVLYIMWTQGFKESVIIIPVWVVLMYILFKVLNAKKS